jgi:hypothetical protein
MLNHSQFAPTRRIRLDFWRLLGALGWTSKRYGNMFLFTRAGNCLPHAVISEILTGRFSRQLFVAATANRRVSKASSGPGEGVSPSRKA